MLRILYDGVFALKLSNQTIAAEQAQVWVPAPPRNPGIQEIAREEYKDAPVTPTLRGRMRGPLGLKISVGADVTFSGTVLVVRG